MWTKQADSLGRDLVLGFVAGLIAVPTFHQFMIFVLTHAGMMNGTLYSMRPVPPMGVPAIVSNMFFGGLWGLVLAAVVRSMPNLRPVWLAGLLLGAIALPLVGWFVVAPLKHQPIAAGWNPMRMVISVLINGCWGLGAGLILTLLRNLTNSRSIAPA